MKITMYELYGKIYDENPPKYIRVYGEEWYWNDYDGYVTKESLKTTPDAQIYLMDRYRTFMNLDQEVEIIEEKKIPEKSNIDFNTKLPVSGCSENEAFMMTCISHLGKTIDSLIDYFKSKGE